MYLLSNYWSDFIILEFDFLFFYEQYLTYLHIYYNILNIYLLFMDTFSTRILGYIQEKWLVFPGLDDQAVLNQVLPVAEEWIMMQIVTRHLSLDDQVIFRDAYLSAPDIFDPIEFLSDILPDFDNLVNTYFDMWLAEFGNSL